MIENKGPSIWGYSVGTVSRKIPDTIELCDRTKDPCQFDGDRTCPPYPLPTSKIL